jgi:6-phosphogluconolactonase (cycloisomerase 2 family)
MNTLLNFPTSALSIYSMVFAFGTACLTATESGTVQTSRVYTETNASAGNSVLVYNRSAGDGSLTLAQTVATGQNGTGAFLEAQGALLLVSHFLLAVNAGSNTISVLDVAGPSVSVAGTFSSGGVSPKSLTAFGGTIYVLNLDGITGFTLDTTTGTLTPIANSSQPLSGLPDPEPAQIGFTDKGGTLVVTEKNTNVLDVYAVADGVAGKPAVYSSNAPNPYGFAAGDSSRLYVTEGNAAVPLGSSVSSYSVSARHVPEIISASVPTGETGACWVALNAANTFAYVADNDSRVISVFSIDGSGHLTLNPSFNVTTAMGPYDVAISVDGKNLYVLQGPSKIVSYTVNADGSLTFGAGVEVGSSVASGLVSR